MSPKAIIFLVVLMLSSSTIMAESNETTDHRHGFGFEKLKGCHRGQNVTGLHRLKQYLARFGYLNYRGHNNNGHANDDEFDDALEVAIKLYQQKNGLKVTGTLDEATADQMSMPRCGYPDIDDDSNSTDHQHHHHHHSHGRKLIHGVSRFSFFPGAPRWQRSRLTYRFTAGATPATAEARAACARAFRRWEQVSHFRFQEVSGSGSDIHIGFYRRDHGDGNPFDGPNGIFAHAANPPSGFFHYDAEERWTVDPTRDGGLDLESVAVHEIGHVLGLGHEPGEPDAIMFPRFSYGIVKRVLHPDDIRGIRTLYGLGN